jgi:large subunit ribosomal protein L4
MATKLHEEKKTRKKISHPKDVHVVTSHDLDLNEDHRMNVRSETYSQYVRALMQNWRQGTVSCKGRSDVSFSNKKPWKQKGTGRARAGSPRSPLWRSGGVIFGPQPRTRTMKISKTMRRSVGNKLLWNQLDYGKIVLLDWEPKEGAPKTADAFAALKKAGLHERTVVFFVAPDDRSTHFSFANIPSVRMMLFDQWNAYDVTNGSVWMVLKKDLPTFKELVHTWI